MKNTKIGDILKKMFNEFNTIIYTATGPTVLEEFLNEANNFNDEYHDLFEKMVAYNEMDGLFKEWYDDIIVKTLEANNDIVGFIKDARDIFNLTFSGAKFDAQNKNDFIKKWKLAIMSSFKNNKTYIHDVKATSVEDDKNKKDVQINKTKEEQNKKDNTIVSPQQFIFKNKNAEQLKVQPLTKKWDKDSTFSKNAQKITSSILKPSNQKMYIDQKFGFGKTETLKYWIHFKDKFNDLSNYNIIYIDCAILAITSDDNKKVIIEMIQEIISQISAGNNKTLKSKLLSLAMSLSTKSYNLNISQVISLLKKYLEEIEIVIIFDDLDRVSRKFALFLIRSISNNIISNSTKAIYVLSDKDFLFSYNEQYDKKAPISNHHQKYLSREITLLEPTNEEKIQMLYDANPLPISVDIVKNNYDFRRMDVSFRTMSETYGILIDEYNYIKKTFPDDTNKAIILLFNLILISKELSIKNPISIEIKEDEFSDYEYFMGINNHKAIAKSNIFKPVDLTTEHSIFSSKLSLSTHSSGTSLSIIHLNLPLLKEVLGFLEELNV